jgi:multidrug efflux pump subunit AcrA (membrane-fusion protein)
LSGRLTAERQATVRAEAAGTLQRVEAEPGQRVREGEVLARVEDSPCATSALGALVGDVAEKRTRGGEA